MENSNTRSLEALDKWERHMRDSGMSNPLGLLPEEQPTEMKTFLANKEIWMGQYLFEKYGYNELSNFAQKHSQEDLAFTQWYANLKPCEGKDGSCNIFCPIFNICMKRDNPQYYI